MILWEWNKRIFPKYFTIPLKSPEFPVRIDRTQQRGKESKRRKRGCCPTFRHAFSRWFDCCSCCCRRCRSLDGGHLLLDHAPAFLQNSTAPLFWFPRPFSTCLSASSKPSMSEQKTQRNRKWMTDRSKDPARFCERIFREVLSSYEFSPLTTKNVRAIPTLRDFCRLSWHYLLTSGICLRS